MNKNATELVFVIDRSGSMSGQEGDTAGGFNSMIAKQKNEEGSAYVSVVLFNNESSVLMDRVSLDKVEPLRERDCQACGCTALLDAVGDAIKHIGNVHKYARKEDVPAHTVFIITTDGMENASHRYDARQVKNLIERQKRKYGWEFLYFGANIDAVREAEHIGIHADRVASRYGDGAANRLQYEAMSASLCDLRMGEELGANWSEPLAEDKANREK